MTTKVIDYYTTINRKDVIPECPYCYLSDCVELVDTAVTNSNQADLGVYTTIPIWHCKRCSKMFGDRTHSVDNFLASHSLTQTFVNTDAIPVMNLPNRLLTVESDISILLDKICELEKRIDNQNDDILTVLRTKVATFNLT